MNQARAESASESGVALGFILLLGSRVRVGEQEEEYAESEEGHAEVERCRLPALDECDANSEVESRSSQDDYCQHFDKHTKFLPVELFADAKS